MAASAQDVHADAAAQHHSVRHQRRRLQPAITAVGGNGPTPSRSPRTRCRPGSLSTPTACCSGTPSAPRLPAPSRSRRPIATATPAIGPTRSASAPAGGITFTPGSPLPDGTQGRVLQPDRYGERRQRHGTGLFDQRRLAADRGFRSTPPPAPSPARRPGAGHINFTVFARDDHGNTGTRAYAVNIIVPITVNPASLPNGTTGTPYSQTVSGKRRHRALHLRGDRGLAADGLTLNASSGAHHRHADRRRHLQFHDPGDRRQRQHRQPRLQGDDQHRAADDQSGEPAGRTGGHRPTTRPSPQAAARAYSYARGLGLAADRAVAQPGDRRDHRHSVGAAAPSTSPSRRPTRRRTPARAPTASSSAPTR